MKYNLTGQRFGKLTALFEQPERKNRKIVWHCKCDCGNECDVVSSYLVSGHTQSCGCLQKARTSAAARKGTDLTGQKFNKLTVLKRANDSAKWICLCDCGNLTEVTTSHLRSGHTKSCGCLKIEQAESRLIDLTGYKTGLLTVIGLDEEKSTPDVKYWLCKCECGNIISVSRSALLRGDKSTQSCGCIRLSHGEEKIKAILTKHNIQFEQEKTFPSCINPLTNRPLRFDFFVDGQYLIEYDGEQHYKQVNTHWEPLEDIQRRDRIKDAWCKEHNITLIRIPYTRLNTLTIEDLLPKRGR